MAAPNPYSCVLLDIEGTTTSISFVYDVLFPYASAHVAEFLKQHWDDAAVQSDINLLSDQAREDHANGLTEAPLIPEVGSDRLQAAIANVQWQMSNDRKTTGLKSLQGKIWRDGYQSGTLKGHVFPDVHPALLGWKEANIPVYIYSSGSVAAQKLLFGFAEPGDLMPLLSGYFDTTTGPKKEARSYRLIVEKIGYSADTLLFLTDNLGEAEAAREAGVQAVLSDRPGNHPLPAHDFPIITTFSTLHQEQGG